MGIKLLLFPHAGGSARSYMTFKRYLDPSIDVVAIEPSGRGMRIDEKKFDFMPDCAADIIDKYLYAFTSGPYAIFGHSMGTLLSLETVRQAVSQGIPEPQCIIMSGRNAPDSCRRLVSGYTDEIITAYFSDHHLLPDILLNNSELKSLMIPTLANDVRMTENYQLDPQMIKLHCPIFIFCGKDDDIPDLSGLKAWNRFTVSDENEIRYFPGDHFYFQKCKEEVCSTINSILKNYTQ